MVLKVLMRITTRLKLFLFTQNIPAAQCNAIVMRWRCRRRQRRWRLDVDRNHTKWNFIERNLIAWIITEAHVEMWTVVSCSTRTYRYFLKLARESPVSASPLHCNSFALQPFGSSFTKWWMTLQKNSSDEENRKTNPKRRRFQIDNKTSHCCYPKWDWFLFIVCQFIRIKR